MAAPVSPPLGNFSYWNSGFVTPDEANGAGGQAFLTALRKYDPNAAFVSSGLNSTEGGGNNYLALNYDPSKLPGMSGSGQLSSGPSAAPGQIGKTFQPFFSSVVNPNQVKSAGDIVNSPTYGNVALNTNFKPQNNGAFDLLALLPLAFAGAGAAGLLPTFGGGADAAAGAAGSAAGASGALGGYVGPDVSGALPAADLSTFGATTPTVGAGADTIGAIGGGAAAGAAAPIIDQSIEAPFLTRVAAQLGIPVNGMALSGLGGDLATALKVGNTVNGLLGAGSLTGGDGNGGGGGAINLGGNRQIADAGSLLRAFYAPRVKGSGQGNEALDPNNPMSLLPLRMMGLIQ